MNAVHPQTYHLIKAEEAHRLARLERRAMVQSAHKADGHQQPHAQPVQRRSFIPRAAGVAVATVALLLSVLVGGALANEQAGSGGGGGGGATRISIQ